MAPASLAATNQKANSDLLEAVKAGDELKVVAALAQPGVDVNCRDEGYNPRTPLLLACNPADGQTNWSVVRLLLEDSRVNVNARDMKGHTALHSCNGKEELVKQILLSRRTDTEWNAADMIGQTPLLWFAPMGAEKSVRRLIGVESVNLFATTIDGFTALHQVAERKTPLPGWMSGGHISNRCNIVHLVLEEVGRRGHNVVSFVDATDILNRSALHYIAEEGCIEILEFLCKFSANMNVNGVDFHGFTPLHLAVRNGHDAMVKRLLQLQSIDANVRATVNASNPDKLKPFEKPEVEIYRPNLFLKRPEEQPSRDLTPLHFVVIDGRMEVVRLLLEWEGINIDPVDSAGLTPLQYSVQNGHWEGKPFATLNIDAVDSAGHTPLQFAVMDGRMEVVRLLLEWEGINIDPVDSAGLTPLQYSVQNGLWEIAELLLKKAKPFVTLNIDVVDSAGRTLLHLAVMHGRMEVARLLLEREGIDIDAVDSAGLTPLQYSVQNGLWEIAELLLKKAKPFVTLNIDVVDSAGRTLLHLAVMHGRMEVARLLLEREGIDIDAVDNAGLTPLHYSVQNGHSEVVDLLLKKGKPFATLDYDRQCSVFEYLLHLATKLEEKTIAKTIAIQLLNTLGSRLSALADISTEFSGNQSFSDQSRLLASAAVSNHFEIIKYIVKWQPEVNVNERSEWAAIPGLVATPLHFAAVERDVATVGGRKRGHLEAVQELLEHPKLDVNAEDNKKMTPLRYAIEAGNEDMAKVLFQKDKFNSFNEVDNAGRTELHLAVVFGRMEVVRLLLEREGINIDPVDSAGLTPLQYSVDHWEIMEMLLKKGKPFATLNIHTVNSAGHTSLHFAVMDARMKVVRLLLEWEGINIDPVDSAGLTPLQYSVQNGHWEIVELLLKKGKPFATININAMDSTGRTPLHFAVMDGPLEVVRLLLEQEGINIDAVDSAGRTPLHFAVMDGRMEVVRLLLEQEGINIDPVDSAGLTPLHYSVQNGHTEVMKLLFKKGKPFTTLDYATLDYNRQCGFFEDLLRLATKNGHVETVQELLEHPKLDVNAEDNKNMTPLRYAIEAGNVAMVEVLCQKDKSHRFNINAVDSAGRTPLHFAVMDGRWEVVRLLLEREGINIDAEDNAGLTPLQYSIQNGHTEGMKLLLNKGKPLITVDYATLDYNRQCGFFENLLCLATKSGRVETVQELLEHPKLDVNAKDNKKMTPLLYAIIARNVDIVKVLCKDKFHRLRATEENPDGKTPLEIVVEPNNLSENPKMKVIEKVLLEQPEVKDFVERLYRDRQVFVDAANALLVGAALIASVTFAGWLQPPLGYTPYYDFSQPFPAPPGDYESYAAIEQNPKVKAFWVFNSLSFFFAIATVLAGADAAMPSLDNAFIGRVVKSVRRSLIVASILLVMSVVCVLGAFASGGLAVLPPVLKYDTSMIITVCVGGTVCMIILAKFLWKLAKAIHIRVQRRMKPDMLVGVDHQLV